MTLPAFADTEDLRVRLPAGLDVDLQRTQAALDDASALIHAASAEVWVEGGALVDDVPPIALMICCKAAIRAIVNPSGITQEATGPFSATFGDVYLTSKETGLIKQAAGGTSGLWTLSTTRSDPYTGDLQDVDGTLYVDVVGGEPIPLMPTDWP